jgi:hypothetical protein
LFTGRKAIPPAHCLRRGIPLWAAASKHLETLREPAEASAKVGVWTAKLEMRPPISVEAGN